jgi:hypothetical protein
MIIENIETKIMKSKYRLKYHAKALVKRAGVEKIGEHCSQEMLNSCRKFV